MAAGGGTSGAYAPIIQRRRERAVAGRRKGKYQTDETVGVMDPRGIEPPHRNLAEAIDRSGIERQQFTVLMDVSEKTLNAWIAGNPTRDPQKRLTNGELMRAAHLLKVNIPYLLDLTEDPAQPKGGAPMPGDLGQYERGRRLIRKYLGIAKDPDKAIRPVEGDGDVDEYGNFTETQESGYRVPYITTPNRIGAKPEGVWKFYQDEYMDDAGFTDWMDEVFRVCGDGDSPEDVLPDRALFLTFYLDKEDHSWFMEDYRKRTAGRLGGELEAIPGDYRSLAGVCNTMIDELRRCEQPELVDRACMVVSELYEQIAYKKRGD